MDYWNVFWTAAVATLGYHTVTTLIEWIAAAAVFAFAMRRIGQKRKQ
jgi:hypothetical protein